MLWYVDTTVRLTYSLHRRQYEHVAVLSILACVYLVRNVITQCTMLACVCYVCTVMEQCSMSIFVCGMCNVMTQCTMLACVCRVSNVMTQCTMLVRVCYVCNVMPQYIGLLIYVFIVSGVVITPVLELDVIADVSIKCYLCYNTA